MTDRTCIKCNTEFKYPSLLKRHFLISSRCSISIEEINLFFNPISNDIVCKNCNKTFSRKYSLLRHQQESKCLKHNITTTNLTLTTTPNPTPNSTSTTIPISNQSVQINSNNTTNNSNTVIINNTINNTINIQHINPFGYEDVRVIPIEEMKKILNTGYNSGFQIIKAIYSKIENKNFYKPNMSKSDIAFLTTEFNLSIKKSKEFCDALFDRCIVLLHHMLYLCKNEFSKTTIKNIYDNIEHIENTMRTEIYDKKLQNIIESEFRNNNIDNKDRIKKFIKDTKDNNSVKDSANIIVNNSILLSNDSDKEYKLSITDKELNDALGDPKVLIGLSKKQLAEDFIFHRYENTRFYKFWKDRMENERLYIKRCKTATIGDMKNLKNRSQAIELMLNVIKTRAESLIPGTLIDLDVEGFTFEYIGRHVNDIVDDSEDEEQQPYQQDTRSIHTVDDDLDFFLN